MVNQHNKNFGLDVDARPFDDDAPQFAPDRVAVATLPATGLVSMLPAYMAPALQPESSIAATPEPGPTTDALPAGSVTENSGTGLKLAFLHYNLDLNTFNQEFELGLSDGVPADEQVVDINPGAANSSSPDQFVVFNGEFIFDATDTAHGRELWVSDGTSAGTHILTDIRTGSADALPGYGGPSSYQNPGAHVVFNGNLYFSANDGSHGFELWKTDGTAGGTSMAADITTGGAGSNSNIQYLTVFNDKLYFTVNDGSHPGAIWSWDGTTATQVTHIAAATDQDTANWGQPGAGNLIVAGSHLFFDWFNSSDDLSHADQLYVLDSNASGGATHLGGTSLGGPRNMVNVNGTLWFALDDGTHGYELWKSDGTQSGTAMVANINPDTTTPDQSSSPFDMVAFNNAIYFIANDGTHGGELWKTDGSQGGTVMIKDIAQPDINTNPGGNAFFDGTELLVVGNTLYFAATDGSGDGEHGIELWKSDGTAGGTVIVKDIEPGTSSSNPTELTNINGTLYFLASNPNDSNNSALWKSDGTDAGTVVAATGTDGEFNAFAFIAPAIANNDAFTTTEGTTTLGSGRNVLSDNGSGADTGSGLAVTAVNGNAAAVGTMITLASGAHLTLNADGTFTYDQNHAFDSTPAAASGASNSVAQDSFTYTLNGTATATVSIAINGVDSNDTLLGTSGPDTLSGGIGDDTITGGGGNDTIDGGTGNNTAVYSGPIASYSVGNSIQQHTFTVADNRGGSPDGTDTLSNVLSFQFSDATETFTLDGSGNVVAITTQYVVGNSQTTLIDALDQSPWGTIQMSHDAAGNLQSQRVITDNGSTWVDSFDNANTLPSLWTSKHYDASNNLLEQTVTNDDGTHTLTVYDVANQYSWANATISYDANWNVTGITGTRDDNTHTISLAEVQPALDTLLWFATPYDPNIGGAVDRMLTGGSAIDVLYGFAGNDTINGGGGNDLIVGDRGDDTLTGGTGDDHFTFYAGDGLDTITDFTAGNGSYDVIELRGYGLTTFAQLQPLMTQSGSDTVITFDPHDTITLHNVTMGNLNSGDFILSA